MHGATMHGGGLHAAAHPHTYPTQGSKKPGSLEFVPDKSKVRVVRNGGNMLHAHERRSVVVLERRGATGDGVRVSSTSPRRRLAAVRLLVFFGLDADCTHPQPAHHEEVSYPKAIRRRKVP